MRVLILFLIVLTASTAAYAQPGTTGGGNVFPSPVPPIAPVPVYGPSTSVFDRNGNLFVFDVSYSYSAPEPGQPVILRSTVKVTTRLTVITPNGTAMAPLQYEGAFQVIGAGWYAVYGIHNAYVAGQTAFVPARTLVAFNVTAGAPLSPLPTLEVPIRADVKLSAARDAGAPDTISFVDAAPNPLILGPNTGPTAPAIRRFARFVKYSGGANFITSTPIPLP
jgi:hypothetical protein